MPWVGSSKMKTFGCIVIHFDSTTFWRLPPESEEMPTRGPGALIWNRVAYREKVSISFASSTKPMRPYLITAGSSMLSTTESWAMSPSFSRSSGT